jgi:hypothetical protein
VPDTLEIHAVGAEDMTDQLRHRRSAQVAIFLDQQRPHAVPRSCNRRRTPGRTAAADDDIKFSEHWNLTGRFLIT